MAITNNPSGLLGAAALVLAACGGKATQQDAPVIANIDGHELTTADLATAIPPDGLTPNTLQRAAVDALIDQYLLAQEAQAQGLDQYPAVDHAVRNARRRILAETFAARLASDPRIPPSGADIEAYYTRNPALFSQRRRYSLAIFTIDSAALTDDLLKALEQTTSTDALRQALKRRAVQFDIQWLEPMADELPMSQLAQYSSASVGDVLVGAPANGTCQLTLIAGIELRPNPFDSAKPAIERYLTQLRTAAAIDAYLARARARIRITYYPERGSQADPTGRPVPAGAAPHNAIAEGGRNRDAAVAALN
jgi:peptidyl-prolyl cis-trans isomerase C